MRKWISAIVAGLVLTCAGDLYASPFDFGADGFTRNLVAKVGPSYHGQRLNKDGSGMLCDADCDTGLECGDTDDTCAMEIGLTALVTYTSNTVTLASGSTLAAQAITAATTLSVTGNFAVNTDKFTVAAATGNTVVAGTLGVTGDVTLSGGAGAITVSGSGDSTLVAKDADSTAFCLGAAGALDLACLDTTDASPALDIKGVTTQTALHVDVGDVLADEDVKALGGVTFVAHTIGIDFGTIKIHDDYDALLTNASGDDDDLTYYQGTFGTDAATLETVDCGGLNDTTQEGFFTFVIPATYVAGSTISIVANVGMRTTVADQSATLDFQCVVPDYANADGTVSGDLITPAAQSVNSTTFADKTFVLDDDATGYVLAAGNVIECMIVALCDDDGDAAGGITIVINSIDVVIST